jgi:hypothetical protein
MRKLTTLVVAGVVCCAGAAALLAQDAQAEKTIIANERAANEAFAKGNRAAFVAHVAADGWAIDPMMGRAPVADLLKDFEAMTKDMKISSWDITDSKVQWVDANTAVHSYKWTGTGTAQGKPIPSPVWASSVWTKKNGKWTAVFHHESLAPAAPMK